MQDTTMAIKLAIAIFLLSAFIKKEIIPAITTMLSIFVLLKDSCITSRRTSSAPINKKALSGVTHNPKYVVLKFAATMTKM